MLQLITIHTDVGEYSINIEEIRSVCPLKGGAGTRIDMKSGGTNETAHTVFNLDMPYTHFLSELKQLNPSGE